jgi:hypothetical protein
MAWKYKTKIIPVGNSWKDDDGIVHSPDWMKWSDDDKKKMGLVWEEEKQQGFDDRFYSGRDTDGKLIERKLDDEVALDDNGKEALDPYGNKFVHIGLKNEWINRTKQTAKNILAKTDWYAVRKAEAGTAIPSDIAEYRAKIRTESNTIEGKINACSKLSEFMALFEGETPAINNFSKS